MYDKKVPFFSIVIPTLNEEKLLPRLLESLAKQEYTSFEIIIVDGGSKDHTIERAKEYTKDVTLQIIVNKIGNVSEQRNRGAKEGKGQYVVFFDADVMIARDYLQKLSSQLSQDPIEYATTCFRVDSSDVLDKFGALMINYLFKLLLFIGRPFMGGTNMIFSQSAFLKLKGFDPLVIHAEDIDIAQRAAKMHMRGRYYFDNYHIISLRRFDREGRWGLCRKYMHSFFHNLFIGPIKKPLFDYRMGGQEDHE